MVFYDVATFSFESVRKDSLRDFGFSKDAKFKEVQVVMGLLIDREGIPIEYDLFSGNTFEGKTLEVTLSKLEKRFSIRKVIIVANKEGINSKINLKKITYRGYDYIFASLLKNLKKDVRQEIFKDDYHKMGEISYKVINYINKIKKGYLYEYRKSKAKDGYFC
ncbi:MAG: putative membrane protein [candidate division TA06 bacterium 34_109]|uniref:Putative membrane protein n=1 Tax=candidate division TA06 bacterium 34_109 TaxID=1635277 RepID=A0A101HYD9_UNCT6|nr:MAG: putative membrane protein [candidate division TA06 bacterium 34_109]